MSVNHLMKSHEASCFSGVLLNTATFAPNWTVFALAGSDCGRFAMLHLNGALSARSLMNGTLEVDARKNASFPAAKSFWKSKPFGV